MGMDLGATLGYGIQVIAEEGDIRLIDADLLEDLYSAKDFPENMLSMERGGYEGQDKFVLYTNSMFSAGDWTPEAVTELPTKESFGDQALRIYCEKHNITQEFKWWLIPLYW